MSGYPQRYASVAISSGLSEIEICDIIVFNSCGDNDDEEDLVVFDST